MRLGAAALISFTLVFVTTYALAACYFKTEDGETVNDLGRLSSLRFE